MPNDKRAPEESLAELHGFVAQELKARIVSGEATPADINAAIKFLKDNNINCDGRANPDLLDITEGLPTYGDAMSDEDTTDLLH